LEPLTTGLVLAADAAIDLQMHTTYSDGKWTPEQLIDYLAGEQFALVAVTDHERVDTIASLRRLAAPKRLHVLAAAEMSTTWNGDATDILCYGFALGENELYRLAQDVLHQQRAITREVYAKLLQQGYTFPQKQDVLRASEGEPRNVDDLVSLLEQHAYATNVDGAAEIVWDAGFFYATNGIAAVVDATHRCGGVCLIAHPGRGGEGCTRYDAALFDQLRQEVPIDGFEVYYPTHTPEQTAMYLEYAQKHHLLTSSGSDSHGPDKKPIKYSADLSRDLLERLGIRVK